MAYDYTSADYVLIPISAAVLLCITATGCWIESLGYALAAGFGCLVFYVGFNYDIVPPASIRLIGIILASWIFSASLEAVGSLYYMTCVLTKLFRKTRWAFPLVVGCFMYGLSLATGSSVVAYAFMPLFVEVCKDTGLRPSKVLVPTVIAAQLGEIASPFSSISDAVYGDIEDYSQDNPGRLEGMAILIPSAFVAVIIVSTLCIWYGHDLSESRRFKNKLLAGLCLCNRPEKYLSPEEVQTLARNVVARSAMFNRVIVSDSHKLRVGKRDISGLSLLSEGDYIYNEAIVEGDAPQVNINLRTSGGPRIKKTPRKTQGDILTDRQIMGSTLSDLPGVAGIVGRYDKKYQLIAIGLGLLCYSFIITWAILTSKWLSVIDDRGLDIELIIFSSILTASFLVVIACRLSVDRLFFSRYLMNGFVGVTNTFSVSGMVSAWHTRWLNPIKADIIRGFTDTPGLLPLIIAFISLASNSIFAPYSYIYEFIDKVDNQIYIASIPCLIATSLLPWTGLVICSVEVDDTRSTRLGRYVVDNVFFIAILLAAAISSGVAYGIANAMMDKAQMVLIA